MSTIRTRIARITRLTAASALALALGAGAAGPALASYNSWAGSVPDSVTFAADDGASTDGIGRPGGIRSVEDGASPDGLGRPGGIHSVEDGASPDALILAGDFAPAWWASPAGGINAI